MYIKNQRDIKKLRSNTIKGIEKFVEESNSELDYTDISILKIKSNNTIICFNNKINKSIEIVDIFYKKTQTQDGEESISYRSDYQEGITSEFYIKSSKRYIDVQDKSFFYRVIIDFGIGNNLEKEIIIRSDEDYDQFSLNDKRNLSTLKELIQNKSTKQEIEYSSGYNGVVFYDGKFRVYNNLFEIEEVDTNIEQATDVFNALIENSSVRDKRKISTIFKWMLISPFTYYIKKNCSDRDFVTFLFLHGERDSSKTYYVESIFAYLWDFDISVKSLGQVDTTYRLGRAFSLSYGPTLIDECGSLLTKPFAKEMIKSSFKNDYARERGKKDGGHELIPARSNMVFTTNDMFRDTVDSVLKRFTFVDFSPEDTATKEEQNLFYERFDNGEVFKSFKAIGWAFINYINERLQRFKENPFKLLDDFVQDLIDNGLNPIISETYEDPDTVASEIINITTNRLKKDIIKSITKEFNKQSSYLYTSDAKEKLHGALTEEEAIELRGEYEEARIDQKKYFLQLVKDNRLNDVGVYYIKTLQYEDNIIITRDIIKKLSEAHDSLTLQKISSSINGETRVISINGSATRSIIVKLDDFIQNFSFINNNSN